MKLIDELLVKVSPFGEVRLPMQEGHLRFVATTQSYDALKKEQVMMVRECNCGEKTR